MNIERRTTTMSTQKFLLSILCTVLMASVNSDVQGQLKTPTGHLKKSDPDELYVSIVQGNDCPRSMEQIVESELAQSRIKRKEFWIYNELNLYVTIDCLRLDNKHSVYSTDVNFGEFVFPTSKQPDEFDFVRRLYGPNYGSFGIASNENLRTQLRNSIRESLEKALLEYLKINFDL